MEVDHHVLRGGGSATGGHPPWLASPDMSERTELLELLARASSGAGTVRVVSPAGEAHASYRELWRKSGRVADVLAPNGWNTVAGLLTPSLDMIAVLIGVLRAGCTFVSLPLRGRAQSAQSYGAQLRGATALAGADLFVVDSSHMLALRSALSELPVPLRSAEQLMLASRGPARDVPGGHLIQFSSGTTGTPKGVVLSADSIAACTTAMCNALEIGEGDSILHWVPLSHDMGLIGGLITAWTAAGNNPGGRSVSYHCMAPEVFVTRPTLWFEECSLHSVTHTMAPTFGYHMATRHLMRSPPLGLDRLRACVVGAEPIDADTLERFGNVAHAHGLREHALCPAYGLAEAALAVSMERPGRGWSTRSVLVDGERKSFVSCGATLPCVEAESSGGQAASPIRIRGASTCGAHLPPRSRVDGWIDTGDLGTCGDVVVVTGRTDDLLTIAGQNIFAWELERRAQDHPMVRTGCCIAVQHTAGRYVLLFEPARCDAALGQESLHEVRTHMLRSTGLAPTLVGCLPRGSLPKTASGKRQRNRVARDLPKLLEACSQVLKVHPGG